MWWILCINKHRNVNFFKQIGYETPTEYTIYETENKKRNLWVLKFDSKFIFQLIKFKVV